jgi:hypothetical protein
MTSAGLFAFFACSYTRWIIGLPAISFNGLPGSRVEAYRAGITQITFMKASPLLLLWIHKTY